MGAKYVIDTSSLLGAWNEHYSIKVFPKLWDSLKEYIRQGDVLIHPKVREEIKKKDDNLTKFLKKLKQFKQILEERDKELNEVRELSARYKGNKFVKSNKKGLNEWADPYLIVCAKLKGYTVITEEKETLKDRKIIDHIRKIPDVCRKEDVTCTNFHKFMIEEGWKF